MCRVSAWMMNKYADYLLLNNENTFCSALGFPVYVRLHLAVCNTSATPGSVALHALPSAFCKAELPWRRVDNESKA